jgi:NAD(P)-dependent dehydrogenase (short-subunit alcohol dehydrogenase family)
MTSSTTLSGRTALVTGATAGIGRAVALELAGQGAELVVHGRDAGRGAALVAELRARGTTARFVAADLTDADQTVQLAADAGDVDILVNSAGIYEFTTTPGTDVEAFDRQFAVNTRAPFLLVGAIAPRMAARGGGVIVNVSSTAATSPAPVGAAYGASKAALELLTRSWATEFAHAGVRINAVSPGPTRTDGTMAMLGEQVESMGRGNLRGTVGEPREIAAVVGFLAGPASSYVNGSVFVADGGALSTMPG